MACKQQLVMLVSNTDLLVYSGKSSQEKCDVVENSALLERYEALSLQWTTVARLNDYNHSCSLGM